MGRAGRKRKPGKREPNGKLSRNPADTAARRKEAWDAEERETMSAAIGARQRIHRLPYEDAKDPMAGSFIGLLCLSGELTTAQYDALVEWEKVSRAYWSTVGGPKPDGALDPNHVSGRGGHGSEAHDLLARARYLKVEAVIREKQTELRGTANLFGALYECVTRDRMHSHLVGDLRHAANALAKHYGLEGKAAA